MLREAFSTAAHSQNPQDEAREAGAVEYMVSLFTMDLLITSGWIRLLFYDGSVSCVETDPSAGS